MIKIIFDKSADFLTFCVVFESKIQNVLIEMLNEFSGFFNKLKLTNRTQFSKSVFHINDMMTKPHSSGHFGHDPQVT